MLVAVAVRGLLTLRRPAQPGAALPHSRVLRRFVGLTAINPTTAVYFVVLTTGLGHVVSGAAAGTAFVAGVLLASCAWQLTLGGRRRAGRVAAPRGLRAATSLAGYVLVAGYGVRLALG